MQRSDFWTLFELLPIGAYRSSAEGRQLRANAALVRLNGYDSEAELLAAVNDIAQEWYVDPQQRRRFRDLIERDGQVVDFCSEIYRHKTRERIWIRENAHVVRDDRGTLLYFEGTVEDVTESRRAQNALQASERRFHSASLMPSRTRSYITAGFTGGKLISKRRVPLVFCSNAWDQFLSPTALIG